MLTSLYGLYIENVETAGHNPIKYFDTQAELENGLNTLKAQIPQLPQGKRLFTVEHDYNEKSNVIVEFNYDKRVYVSY